MENAGQEGKPTPHHLRVTEPSPWVRRFAPLVAGGGTVLDLACGNGRHARLFLERGHSVVAIDRDLDAIRDLAGRAGFQAIAADLENGGPWPLGGRAFASVVVVNYLHRPLFPFLLGALAPKGVFLYETFARGNERLNRPRNPAHLLEEGELLDVVRGRLRVVAYEYGLIRESPTPGVIQRLAAVSPERPVVEE